jgi:hypothetical protein
MVSEFLSPTHWKAVRQWPERRHRDVTQRWIIHRWRRRSAALSMLARPIEDGIDYELDAVTTARTGLLLFRQKQP